MSEEEKKPLFREGMKVTCLRHGVGVVEGMYEDCVFPVSVKFNDGALGNYTACGKLYPYEPSPMLYPGAVEITVKQFDPDYELDQPIWGWRGEGYNVSPYHFSYIDDDGTVFVHKHGRTSHTSHLLGDNKLMVHGLTKEEVECQLP